MSAPAPQPRKKRRCQAPAPQDAPPPAEPLPLRGEWAEPGARARLREQFQQALPFPHVTLRPFLGEPGLKAVRGDLEALPAREKETDLFRFFQTGDLAPLAGGLGEEAARGGAAAASGGAGGAGPAGARRAHARGRGRGRRRAAPGAPAADRTPALAALARSFASPEFRRLCQEITECGELSDRLDLSAQIYPRGSHLLCHDDVIGTRKISFIYYLTDPSEEWAPSEGGALELYAPQPGAPPGTPATAPAKEILPLADALVLFVVEPGVSFHSVREVRGKRARVSIQGWLHAPALDLTRGFANRGLATLAQLVQGRTARAAEPQPPRAEPAMAAPAPAGPPVAPEAEEWGLTAEDTAALSEWVAPEYLSAAHLEAIAERFAEASYAVLSGFLRPDVFERLSALHAAVDAADGFGAGRPEPAAPPYGAGAAGGWRAVGPPHLRRHLRYDGGAATPEQGGGGGDGPHRQLGAAMQRVASGLLGSTAFRRWLHACTRLEPRPCGAAEVRRFRPGLDYTVAVCPPAEAGGAELDATLVFVEGGASASGGGAAPAGGASAGGAAGWDEEDLGGFESYLAADDEEETAQAQEVYRGSDEGPLVNLPAAANSLCLVMRDPGTLRFVKFLSRDAPSSRADVAGCFSVDMPEESDPEPAAAVERPAGPP